jgi:hypothetical protein
MDAIIKLNKILIECFENPLDKHRIEFISGELAGESADHLNKLCKEILVNFDYNDTITARDIFSISESIPTTINPDYLMDFSEEEEQEAIASF